MIIRDCECINCGNTYDITEMGFAFFVEDEKYNNFDSCKCPKCGSQNKEEHCYDFYDER